MGLIDEKKTESRKSRDTVPLNIEYNSSENADFPVKRICDQKVA
jgi:hypothetical protein